MSSHLTERSRIRERRSNERDQRVPNEHILPLMSEQLYQDNALDNDEVARDTLPELASTVEIWLAR